MTRVSGCLAVSSPSPATARQHRKKRDSVETVGEIWTLNIWQIRFSHETPQETFPEAGCLEGVSPERDSKTGLGSVLADLESRYPDLVPIDRWQAAIEDGRRFLARWGNQAEALGWTARELFGLQTPPAKPHPSYSRLSRYDETGLIWLLRGREVVALTEATAAIQNPTGAISIYRRHNKPALGPPGDSLDDLA